MLKKVMLYLMVLMTACKFFTLAFLLSTNGERLPLAIYCSTGIVVGFGLFLICKWIISAVKRYELVVYYLMVSASVVFNLLYMKMFSRMELSLVDFLIIGTVMDILLSAAMVFYSTKERRYVKIPQTTAKSHVDCIS